MSAYHFSTKHNAYVKDCPKCLTTFIGTLTQDNSERIFDRYFAQDKAIADGFYGRCRKCVSKYQRQNRDGRICDPDKMLAEQGGQCALCPKELTFDCGNQAKVWAYVDHDHETNKVRGILCPRCNTMLSQIEKEGWVEKAIAYIERFKCE